VALEAATRERVASSLPDAHLQPAFVGSYRILRLIGEGGMGAVYEAEQEEPRRVVAVKMIKLGLAAPDQMRRFRQESQALARLQHPGIAQIYESNTADTGFGTQPYFAMEFIRGIPLDEYAETHRLDTRQRLGLIVKVCEAVHHAHQRGLIHRDLKPGNILVDETGQPKILDFGVARFTQTDAEETCLPKSVLTSLGQIVGTLAYMSPEQVLGDPLEVDIRSDVYSLGVVVYQLLSGSLPYRVNQRQFPEAVQAIREEEPPGLGTIDRNYRGDIENIVKKALEKDKARRYASAVELGADIDRYLRHEPIAARPPSTTYQIRKFAYRHRGLMAAVAAVFVVLVAGIAAAASMAVRASRAEGEARAVSDFLQNDLLEQAGASAQATNSSPNLHLEVRTALDRAAARIPGKFAQEPLVEASIRQTIGNTYQDLGLYREAEQQDELALVIRRRRLGEKDPDTLKSIDRLAVLYRLEGKYAKAEPLRKELLDIREQSLGDLHPDTLDAMNNLALLYRYEGKPALAEPLYVKAVDGLRRLKLINTQSVGTMSNLAQLYNDEAKYAEAERLFKEALAAAPRVYGQDHPGTMVIMNNLAQLYLDEGKLPEAEQLQRKVFEVDSRTLGPEHPEVMMDLGNLAKIFRNEGKYPESEAAFRRVLETLRRVLGEDRPATLTTVNLLGTVKYYEGDYAAAEKLFSQALAGDRRVLGNEHPTTASSLLWVGRACLKLGKYNAAESNFREAMNTYAKIRPAGWERYNAASLLGQSLAAQNRFGDAELLLISGYQGLMERRDKVPAINRPDVESSGEQIVRLYDQSGKLDKALEWRSRLNADSPTPKPEPRR